LKLRNPSWVWWWLVGKEHYKRNVVVANKEC
jgi:hypothetical protein